MRTQFTAVDVFDEAFKHRLGLGTAMRLSIQAGLKHTDLHRLALPDDRYERILEIYTEMVKDIGSSAQRLALEIAEASQQEPTP